MPSSLEFTVITNKTLMSRLLLTVAILLSLWFGQELYTNYRSLRVTEQRIQSLVLQAADAPKTTDSIERNTKDVTIELAAEGVKLKMVNEATWTSVFKLCFLWFFTLFTLAAYKIVLAKVTSRVD